MKNYETMMGDAADDDDDKDDVDDNKVVDDDEDDDEDDDNDDDGDDYKAEDENCPNGCHCSPRVIQCSDQGQKTCLKKMGLRPIILTK